MLAAGVILTPRYIRQIKEFGFSSLYVYDEDIEDIVVYDYIDEKHRQKITRKVRALFEDLQEEVRSKFSVDELKTASVQSLKGKIEDKNFKSILDMANIRETFNTLVDTIIQNLMSDTQICMCVGAIKTTNTYIYDHSIDVAFHAAVIGRKLGLPMREIREIVLGTLLHDIGYIFIPEDITKKSGRLTSHEVDILRQHAIYGYYLMKDREDIGLLPAHIAYQHHERQDGQGFPRGLHGVNRILTREEMLQEGTGLMHRYAEIVAVPNYYDALISSLPYKQAIAPEEAIQIIKESAGSALNKQVTDVFLSYLPVYPMGTMVSVNDGKYRGYRGIVIKVEPDNLDKPIIRLTQDNKKRRLKDPIEIDLSEQRLSLSAIWK